MPSSPPAPAAQGKDGEGRDRPRGADGQAGTSAPRAAQASPGGQASLHRQWSHGPGGGRRGQSPGLLSASPAASLTAGQRGDDPRGDARNAPGALGWGSSRLPQVPAEGACRAEDPGSLAPLPSGWPEARGGTARRVSQTGTGPGGRLRNQGQIGGQVVVQRSGVPCASRGPAPSGADT